jgi:hypothetical protein
VPHIVAVIVEDDAAIAMGQRFAINVFLGYCAKLRTCCGCRKAQCTISYKLTSRCFHGVFS